MERPKFLSRVFTEAEQPLVQSADEAAGRWAVKEAMIKCVGHRLPWQQMEVLRDRYGKPVAEIRRDLGLGPLRFHVSITHDAGLAIAFAVMESG